MNWRRKVAFDLHERYSHIFGQKVCLESPAKINWRLKVEGRRSDGYHLLSMLNAPTDLTDLIYFEMLDNGSIEVTAAPEFMGEHLAPHIREDVSQSLSNAGSNLAARAIRSFFERFNIPFGARLNIHKNIPVGAGLGGGSSNAGAVLEWLAGIFQSYLSDYLGLNQEETHLELIKIACELGADVPFFLSPRLAWVRGVGEIIEPLYPRVLENFAVFLVLPHEEVATQAVYDAFRTVGSIVGSETYQPDSTASEFVSRYKEFLLSLDYEGSKSSVFAEDLKSYREEFKSLVENDLEDAVSQVSSTVRDVLPKLRALPDSVVSISGSGGAMFTFPRAKNYLDASFTDRIKHALQGSPVSIRATLVCRAV